MRRLALRALLGACGCRDATSAASAPGAGGTAGTPAPAPDAPAAPRTAATAAQRTLLDIEIGKTPIAEASATLARLGITCVDASLFAMMAKAHAGRGVTVPDGALAHVQRGEAPPATAGMPAGHAAYLNDPALRQARLSCVDVPVDRLGDGRTGVTGRLLVIADSDAAPVSFIALQRTYRDADAATADARATFAALDARLGPPLPGAGTLADGAGLERYRPIKRAWAFTDLEASASATDLGDTGLSVSEELRVPAPAP